MTLLSIIEDTCYECKLPAPTIVIGNSDKQVASLLAMSNRSGRSLAKIKDWTVLQTVYTFTTVASQEEYSLPADYSRLIQGTEWDRSDADPMTGPASPQQWQEIKSGLVGQSIVNRRYRIFRSASSSARVIYIDPVPATSGETLAFEYISSYWCESSGGTGQTAWAADTDVPVLNPDLLTLDLICRWKRSNGLDWASEADELMNLFNVEAGNDRPAKTLNLAGGNSYPLLGARNLPETGLTG